MSRGRGYTWWRRNAESLERLFYRSGWAARICYAVGLQGSIHIDRRDIVLRKSSFSTPLRLAFASDFHAGPLTDERLLRAVTAAIADFRPHVVLLGGDFVSLDHRHFHFLRRALESLAPPHGILAVLGNHDLWLDDDFLVAELTALGARVLINQSHRLSEPFTGVLIHGLDDPASGRPSPESFVRGPDASIVLMHSPLGLEALDGFYFDIAFCGHTHGGQVALPTGVPIVLPRGSGPRKYSHGHICAAHSGTQLLVSKGVGMSDVPFRLFAQSEVHLCTIHPSASALAATVEQ